jgi:hypothetical protein
MRLLSFGGIGQGEIEGMCSCTFIFVLLFFFLSFLFFLICCRHRSPSIDGAGDR